MSKPNTTNNATVPAPQQGGAPESKPQGNNHKVTMQGPSKNNVTAMPGMCLAEGCKQRSQKANFCMEHFDWFKEGLITKEGRRPTDFDKKFFDYSRRQAKKKTA